MSIKLRLSDARIIFSSGLIECKCYTIAQSYFGNFNVDQVIFLNEQEDLGGNPSWTNDDLKQALANKTGLSLEEISFE